MKSHQKPDNRASARLFSLMLVLVLVLSLVPAAVFVADSYTSVAKGSVSWTMINQNPDTFYADRLIGIVVRHIPVLGQILTLFGTSFGRICMFCFAACGALLNILGGRLRDALKYAREEET